MVNYVTKYLIAPEIFGLIGPNGAGKTTFLNCISGFYRPEKEELFIRNRILPDCLLLSFAIKESPGREPSLGLAPKLVLDVFKTLKELTTRGVTVLLEEQNFNTTLKIVDRGYVLEQGGIVEKGSSKELRENDHIKKAYLGIG